MSRTDPDTEADLQTFVDDKVQESSRLDYKESLALKKADKEKREIGKDVAALATAEGGMLIYGIAENPVTHEAERIDGGSDPKGISKEWLEQVIDSNVSPRIEGLRITSIELTTSSPGMFAYVVHIPSSDRAPHMASDHRYYMRQNFQSVPMEDYQVRDVFFRRRAPRIELHPFVKKLHDHLRLGFRVRNIGLVAAQQLYMEVEFVKSHISPASWSVSSIPPILSWLPPPLGQGRTTDILQYVQSDAPGIAGGPVPRRLPPLIYPGLDLELEGLGVAIREDADPAQVIQVRLHARDMPVVQRTITVEWVIAKASIGS